MFKYEAEYDVVVFLANTWDITSAGFRTLLYNFSKKHKILVVEVPKKLVGSYGNASTYTPFPNIIVATPHVDTIQESEVLSNIIHGVISKHLDRPAIVWTRNPVYYDVFSKITTKAVVYDLSEGAVFDQSMLVSSSLLYDVRSVNEITNYPRHENTYLFSNPNEFDYGELTLT